MLKYHQMFEENTNVYRHNCRIDECFDISIGKTPPRKEPKWFSQNPNDCVWVSISDMRNSGLYISNSTEYLTREAIENITLKLFLIIQLS